MWKLDHDVPVHTQRMLHSSKTIKSNDTGEIPVHAQGTTRTERSQHSFKTNDGTTILQPKAKYSIASPLQLITQCTPREKDLGAQEMYQT